MTYLFGIDLGTSNSCISYFDVSRQDVQIIKFNDDNFTASVVHFPKHPEDEIITGTIAKDITRNPINTIYESKRFIGKKLKQHEIDEDRSIVNKVVLENNEVLYEIDHGQEKKKISPVEVAAQVLLHLKQQAILAVNDTNLNDDFKAVVTVPANFSVEQRQCTHDAAEIAGIEVIEFVNEPTAAAIAYDKFQNLINGGKYMVIDLGGVTFDVSIVSVHDKKFEVIATDGHTHLGGKDIDVKMFEYLLENNEELCKYVIFQDKSIRQEHLCRKSKRFLLKNCEEAKKLFSNEDQKEIEVTLNNVIPSKELEELEENTTMYITAETFQSLCQPLFDEMKIIIQRALGKKNLRKSDIRDVLLVGGPTKLVCFKKMIEEYFGKKPLSTVDPMLAVCQGAALKAFGTEKQFTDVVPISLGVCNMGVLFQKIIPSGTQIPVEREKTLMTAKDGQTRLSIEIYEGEKDICQENLRLGNFEILIDKPQPKKTPIKVKFKIDSSGLFTVEAKIEGLGIEKLLIVENQNRIKTNETKEILKKQVEEAEKRRREIELKNGLINLFHVLQNDIEIDADFVFDDYYDSIDINQCSTLKDIRMLIIDMVNRYSHLNNVKSFMLNERENYEKYMHGKV